MIPKFSEKHHARLPWLPLAVLLVAGLAMAGLVSLFPQNAVYYDFADRRLWLGIPNFGDVTSNIFLLAAGLAGLRTLARHRVGFQEAGRGRAFAEALERWLWGVFFLAVALTALGSAYFHWAPDALGLFWDRLPLSALVMLIPAILIAERIPVSRAGAGALAVFIAAGPASVVGWIVLEGIGAGDLRWYVLTQGVGLVMSVALLVHLPARFTGTGHYVVAMGLYVLARIFEIFDQAIFDIGQWVSGHTLKHLAVSLAVLALARMVARRSEIPGRPAGPETGASG